MWVLAGVLVSSFGCGSDGHEEILRVAALAEGCLINTDCTEPLVCAFRRCHQECTASRDCQAGQRCVPAERGLAVCQLPDDRKCTYNSECQQGQVCGRDAQCRAQCFGEQDCLGGQACVSGTCADEAELEDGELRPSQEIEIGAGTPCTYNSDCPEPLACVSQRCQLECVRDRDCLPTFRCNADNRCEPEGAEPGDGG